MQIIEWQQFLKGSLTSGTKKTSMTIGIFDGVHRGHQALIKRVVSHNAGNIPAVVTFRQNHKTETASGKNTETRYIQSFQERLAMFEKLGIQITIVIDFTDDFRQMPGIEFLDTLLKCGNIGFFTIGSNFRCGYKLDTDADAIEKFFASHNIPVEVIPQVTENSLPISSSRIRAVIAEGDNMLAQKMLGHACYISDN
jgi:riboflavin kinase/FMN adenylyltransferase